MSATRTSGRDKVWLGHEPQKELWSALFVFLLYNIALPHIISIHVDFFFIEWSIQYSGPLIELHAILKLMKACFKVYDHVRIIETPNKFECTRRMQVNTLIWQYLIS